MGSIKSYIFAPKKTNIHTMQTIKQTREEAMARFMAAKAKKKARIAELEVKMKDEYEKETGLKANYFFAL